MSQEVLIGADCPQILGAGGFIVQYGEVARCYKIGALSLCSSEWFDDCAVPDWVWGIIHVLTFFVIIKSFYEATFVIQGVFHSDNSN
jgi:hypothetical protein